MFYEEIGIKQGLSYISFCPLRVLYISKFIIMATSLRTNVVVVSRVHCISDTYKKVTNPHQAKTCLLAAQDALSEIIMRMRNQRFYQML